MAAMTCDLLSDKLHFSLYFQGKSGRMWMHFTDMFIFAEAGFGWMLHCRAQDVNQ